MVNKNVNFFVRIFPKEKTKTDAVNIVHSDKEVTLQPPESAVRTKKEPKTFQTNGVFTDHCQSEVYSTVIDESTFTDVTRGTSLVVIALGEPLSGKTYTMMGIKESYQFRGLIPRIVKDIYNHNRVSTYKIAVSFIEFMNDKCTDLLSGRLLKDMYYKTIKPTEVTSLKGALDLLFSGEKKRSRKKGVCCGSTVFSVFIYVPSTIIKRSTISQVHMVDAAGLWNASTTETCVSPLRNLHYWRWPFALRQVVFDGIGDQESSFKLVPMIGFLREAILKGKIRLIAHVKDESQSWRYNKWTLALCNELCKRGRSTPARPKAMPHLQRNEDLYNQIQELRDHRDYGHMTNDVIEFVPYRVEDASNDYSTLIKSFLNYERTESDLMSIAHPIILLREMKNFYKKTFGDPGKRSLLARSKKSLRTRGSSSIQSKKIQLIYNQRYKSEAGEINRQPTSDPMENWKIFWIEFLDRYPEKRRELKVAIEELRQARREKELKQENLRMFKDRAIISEKEAKYILWKRSLKGGENDNQSKTREDQLEEEKTIIASGKKFDRQVLEAQNDLALAHKSYVMKLQIFNNISSRMDALFMDYALTTYDCNLALPRAIVYEETVPSFVEETPDLMDNFELEEKIYDELKQRYLFKKKHSPFSRNKNNRNIH